MPLSGRDARLLITSQTATSSTDIASSVVSTGVGGVVQITSTANRHIDPDTTPTIYLNSTQVSSTNYTVNYVQGKFEFKDTAAHSVTSTGTYTIDAAYLTASNVAGARQWQLQVSQEMFEVSEFGSSGWREYQPNLVGANVSLSRYWNTGITAGSTVAFLDLINLNSQFLLELKVSNTNKWKYEGYCYPSQNTVGASVDSIVTEDLNLVVNGKLYFSTD